MWKKCNLLFISFVQINDRVQLKQFRGGHYKLVIDLKCYKTNKDWQVRWITSRTGWQDLAK